jgi:large subunit ribosomal protein L20
MRATNGTVHKKRRAKVLARAKGFKAGRRRLYRTAKDAIIKSDLWAYRDRKRRKREFRRLWITRVGAACRSQDISYSQFIFGLKKSSIDLNRKQLSELAINEPQAFEAVVAQVKKSLAA